jgi:hypothetical protein
MVMIMEVAIKKTQKADRILDQIYTIYIKDNSQQGFGLQYRSDRTADIRESKGSRRAPLIWQRPDGEQRTNRF